MRLPRAALPQRGVPRCQPQQLQHPPGCSPPRSLPAALLPPAAAGQRASWHLLPATRQSAPGGAARQQQRQARQRPACCTVSRSRPHPGRSVPGPAPGPAPGPGPGPPAAGGAAAAAGPPGCRPCSRLALHWRRAQHHQKMPSAARTRPRQPQPAASAASAGARSRRPLPRRPPQPGRTPGRRCSCSAAIVQCPPGQERSARPGLHLSGSWAPPGWPGSSCRARRTARPSCSAPLPPGLRLRPPRPRLVRCACTRVLGRRGEEGQVASRAVGRRPTCCGLRACVGGRLAAGRPRGGGLRGRPARRLRQAQRVQQPLLRGRALPGEPGGGSAGRRRCRRSRSSRRGGTLGARAAAAGAAAGAQLGERLQVCRGGLGRRRGGAAAQRPPAVLHRLQERNPLQAQDGVGLLLLLLLGLLGLLLLLGLGRRGRRGRCRCRLAKVAKVVVVAGCARDWGEGRRCCRHRRRGVKLPKVVRLRHGCPWGPTVGGSGSSSWRGAGRWW
jgi:hypothetical protein